MKKAMAIIGMIGKVLAILMALAATLAMIKAFIDFLFLMFKI